MSVKGLQQAERGSGTSPRGDLLSLPVPAPSRSRWLAPLRPQGLAGGPGELVLTVVSVWVLVLLLGVEVVWTGESTIGALGVFPVSAAGWLLGRRALTVVVVAGMALRGVALAMGTVSLLTALSQAVVLPLAGIACYLAATSRSSAASAAEGERQVRELAFLLRAAERLASSLDAQVILRRAVELTAEGVSRPGGGLPARAAYHRLQDGLLRVEAVEDGAGDTGAGFEYPLARDQGALGALRSGRASIVRPDHMTGSLAEHVLSRRVEALAEAPVRSGEEIHGFLVASSRDGPGMDRRELSLLEVLARMTGLALVNAQHVQIEREHAERMGELEKVKSHILNLVSHELRSPLTVAVGYVSMLEEEALGPLTPESRGVLPIVMSKLNAMETLVGEMLEVSRLEEGALGLKRRPTDLREVCRETVATIRPLLDHQHHLSFAEPSERAMVFADRDRLATILTNLLSNAVKYSPEGGDIRCAVSADHDLVHVAVSDQGLGIAAEDLPRLFTRFGRILTPENRGISGTGLGLYLSRELARQQDGDISVSSTAGVGSTFTLTLPATSATSQGGQAK